MRPPRIDHDRIRRECAGDHERIYHRLTWEIEERDREIEAQIRREALYASIPPKPPDPPGGRYVWGEYLGRWVFRAW